MRDRALVERHEAAHAVIAVRVGLTVHEIVRAPHGASVRAVGWVQRSSAAGSCIGWVNVTIPPPSAGGPWADPIQRAALPMAVAFAGDLATGERPADRSRRVPDWRVAESLARSAVVPEHVARLTDGVLAWTRELVSANRIAIDAVAAALRTRKRIPGDELRAIVLRADGS